MDWNSDGPRALRVLHVDDYTPNRVLVRDVLRLYGHCPTEAGSGEEALLRLEQSSFDLILMDIYMPGMNGLELLKFVRSSAGPHRDTPVIAVTSEVRWTKSDYTELGFNDFVAKPFSIVDLQEAIRRCACPRPRAPTIITEPDLRSVQPLDVSAGPSTSISRLCA